MNNNWQIIDNNGTYYHYVWAGQLLDDMMWVIDNLPVKKVVIFAPEEWEGGSLYQSSGEFRLIEYYIKSRGLELTVVSAATNKNNWNKRYYLIDNPSLLPWDTYFAFQVVSHNINNQIKPLGHKKLTKHFISLNGRSHPWRCQFVDSLYGAGLFDYGMVSWHNSDNWPYEYKWKYWTPEIINFDNNWLESVDGYLDILKPPAQFSECLFSIISESNPNILYVTEKTYVPIYHQRPFIIYGAAYTHEYLRTLGFEMFDNIFDYSFDSEEDDDLRLEMFINECKKITSKDINYLKKITQPIVNHNYKKLIELVTSKKTVSKQVRSLVNDTDHFHMVHYKYQLNTLHNPLYSEWRKITNFGNN